MKLQFLILVSLCGCLVASAESQAPSRSPRPFNEILGPPADGLRPSITFTRLNDQWIIQTTFIALEALRPNSWLKTTNRVGAKLKLTSNDGRTIPLVDSSAAAAWNLPVQANVSDIMAGVKRGQRVLLWWPASSRTTAAGKKFPAAVFDLSCFESAITNDVKLEMTPLMYKVEANHKTAHLVDFPPVRVELKTNGSLTQLE